jgi:hypothetical protein
VKTLSERGSENDRGKLNNKRAGTMSTSRMC